MTSQSKRHDDDVVMGSELSFGLVFAGLFAVLAAYPLVKGGTIRLEYLGVAGVFLALALVRPQLLRPLNIVWFRLGLAIGRIMTPVVMALIYCVTVVPIGLLMRAAGKDVLRLERDAAATSYWIAREEPGPKPGSMKRQF